MIKKIAKNASANGHAEFMVHTGVPYSVAAGASTRRTPKFGGFSDITG